MVGVRVADTLGGMSRDRRGLAVSRPVGALARWLGASTPVFFLLAVPVLVVGVYGLIVLASRSASGATIVAYLAILAVWPVRADRFLWAVLPWIALAWGAGALALWRHARLRLPIVVLATALTLGYSVYEARGFAGRWWAVSGQRISANFTELLPWVETLPADAVLATDAGPPVSLHNRRR